MNYRKFSADYLFTGYTMLGRKWVLVTDENGVVKEIIKDQDAGDDIEKHNGIISPGFINCHCHLELSHMKGAIPEGKGMTPFLLTVMNIRNFDEQFILQCIADAESTMIKNGIAAIGDILNTTHTFSQKLQRNIYYQNFVETTGVAEDAADARFNFSSTIYDQFKKLNQPVSIVPHAPYSVSKKLFELINAKQQGNLLSIHNQESAAENEFFISGTGDLLRLYAALGISADSIFPKGKSSIQTVLPSISADHSLLLVHNVATNKNDLDWIHQNKNILPELFWCLCPNANKYITGQYPAVQLLKDFKATIVIGTDSFASNHELSILSELKALQLQFPALANEELLLWATSNGAKALRIGDNFGDFERGKKPGVILIENAQENSLANSFSRVLL
ncbi:MAG: amidohydrolase family protein [Flavitalea sp.]